MKLLSIGLIFLFAGNAFAEPGDILHVHGTVVNLRQGPSTNYPVLLKLRRGDKLLELQRKGDWVEVHPDGMDGTCGWIYAPLVGKEYVGRLAKPIETQKFRNFKAAFNELNTRIAKQTGSTFFTKPEDLGNGVIQVTATDKWLNTTNEEKERNLRAIFDLWNHAEGNPPAMAVHVIDKDGNHQMSMKQWK